MHIVHPRWSKETRGILRKEMTKAERLFWIYTRTASPELQRIRRQVGIGRFIVDFLHPKTKLIIELDGITHSSLEEKEYDRLRTEWLESHTYQVIRYSNQEVYQSLEAICEELQAVIQNKINKDS